MNEHNDLPEISVDIWKTKYQWKGDGSSADHSMDDTFRRIAVHLAQVESDPTSWSEKFYRTLQDFKFLPGGRIFAGAGTGHHTTLFNCFVMGKIDDSMDGIFEALKEGALTMQKGGGVGYDFSTLRPKGLMAHATHRIASGPVSFMKLWSSMCATVMTTGARRGAMMATLRCDHPDILDFVRAKQRPGELSHFNLSVLVTDEFMAAVKENRDWELVFPGQGVLRTIPAAKLWQEIMASTYQSSEPGVLFVDRINHRNNLWYAESISATNPCGEIPLPNYGACDLGSVNLTTLVKAPFTPNASFDFKELRDLIPMCVRMLDNVIDISKFPLSAQKEMAQTTRRIGLGVTGLADCLAMLNLHYGEEGGREMAKQIMEVICCEAYRASIHLAKEKQPFPKFRKQEFLQGPFVQELPADIRQGIEQHGIRNSHLLAIAPAGTISILAKNISSGIEPIFSLSYTRRVRQASDEFRQYEVHDYAAGLWKKLFSDKPFPKTLVTAYDLSPLQHLQMQAVMQRWVDSSISKTINVPETMAFDDFRQIYDLAFSMGLKGCTTYRPTAGSQGILNV